MDQANKFSKVTIILHWAVALTMIGLLCSGLYMSKTEAWALYPIHKSIGVLIVLLVVPRVLWRIKNGWPKPAGNYSHLENVLAKVVHWVLIIGTVLMPVSGMIMSGLGGHGISVFGLELMANNPDLANPGQVIPLNGSLASIGHETHEILANLLLASLTLHIIGALKHHVLDKDGTLRRMMGKTISAPE